MKNIMCGIMFVALLAACSKAPESISEAYDPDAGRVIAESECLDCHRLDGGGENPDIPNLTAQSAEYLVEAMLAYRDGRRLHAALQDMIQGMTDEEIRNIAGYYADLPPLPARDHENNYLANEAEGEPVAKVCEECHGAKGISDTEGVPSLAGQQPAYLIVAIEEYSDGTRKHTGQEDMLTEMRQVDIERIAMYFASQSAPARPAPPFGDPVSGKAESARCGECHGAKGVSHEALVPSLAGQEPVYLVSAIRAYKNHERLSDEPMPQKTEKQIEDLAAYYSTQKTDAALKGRLSGEQIAAKCDRCHDPASGKRKPNVPLLAGQSHDYLVKAMKEYRREDRDNSMMHKMSARYSDETIEAIARYYAGQ